MSDLSLHAAKHPLRPITMLFTVFIEADPPFFGIGLFFVFHSSRNELFYAAFSNVSGTSRRETPEMGAT